MKLLPRITIITPSLNQGIFIEATIQSVLTQNYPDLEYIVVDGGSTDGTLEVLRRYSDRIRWLSEKDAGQSDAINKGLRMATGEMIGYLNSDDQYTPGALLSVGEFFASHPEASWVSGQCRIIDENGREIRRLIKWYKNFWLFWGSYTILLVLDYISQPATFWRKSLFKDVGAYNTNEHYAFDYDFSLRAGRLFKLWRLNHTLALFRVHSASKGSSATLAQFAADFDIARQYSHSSLLITLHRWHNIMILTIYKLLTLKKSREG